MAPPLQRECALMSASVNPIAGPAAQTTALVAAVMSSPHICCHLVSFLKLYIVVLLVAPWRQKYATRRCMSATGHHWK